MSDKACDGGRVLEAWHEMAECVECGQQVKWNLQDHPFFGFANTCPHRIAAAASGPSIPGSRPGTIGKSDAV